MKDKLELNSNAIYLRRKIFNEDIFSPIDIFALMNDTESLTLVFYPMSDRLSGMCIKEGQSKIIVINSKQSYGRQRFTAAHELYHLFFEDNVKSIICEKGMGSFKSDSEKEADTFASYLLATYDALRAYIEKSSLANETNWTIKDVIKIEQFFQLSHQATLYRLVYDGYIDNDKANLLKDNVIQRAVRLGYDDKLYRPSSEEKQYFSTGEYIKKVEELKNKGLVSNGKYEELLLDAFRSDIVYNLGEEGKELYD
ncbi:MAG: ImmA/IrrE family metallo-endopeptidase [Candidatus Syntrophopropionicum ammoniitolerans]